MLKKQVSKAIGLLPEISAQLAASVQSIDSPGALSDRIAGLLDIPLAEKQKLLEMFDIRQRVETVVEYMAKRLEIIELSHHSARQTRFNRSANASKIPADRAP